MKSPRFGVGSFSSLDADNAWSDEFDAMGLESAPAPRTVSLIAPRSGFGWESGVAGSRVDDATLLHCEDYAPHYTRLLLAEEHLHYVGVCGADTFLVSVEAATERNAERPLNVVLHTRRGVLATTLDLTPEQKNSASSSSASSFASSSSASSSPRGVSLRQRRLSLGESLGSIKARKLSLPIWSSTVSPPRSPRSFFASSSAAPSSPRSARGSGSSKDVLRSCLHSVYDGCTLVRIDDTPSHMQMSLRLVELEVARRDFSVRVGVMVWREGQTESEAYANETSADLEEFLRNVGDRVRLKGWSKFRGGLDCDTDLTGEYSVFSQFGDFQIMAHVAPLLPYNGVDEQQVERKRHVANDLVVIIFWEGASGSFDPAQFVSSMTHVFIVVEKISFTEPGEHPRYRVAVMSKGCVSAFPPFVPEGGIVEAGPSMHAWLMTKIINAQRSVFRSPLFSAALQKTNLGQLEAVAKEAWDGRIHRAPLRGPFDMARLASKTGLLCKAVANFSAIAPDQLSFQKGDRLYVYGLVSSDWYTGGICDQRGNFPANKVVLLSTDKSTIVRRPSPPTEYVVDVPRAAADRRKRPSAGIPTPETSFFDLPPSTLEERKLVIGRAELAESDCTVVDWDLL